jgi:hypothetical protein
MLVAEFDAVDLLDRLAGHCVRLLGAHEAGVVLVDDAGRLTVVAATSEQARFLELFPVWNVLSVVNQSRPLTSPLMLARGLISPVTPSGRVIDPCMPPRCIRRPRRSAR